ncbi:retropepsin-like super family [Candidatus Termititenax persephonae]|uniref:Retropepsin-like super family n=1 Tax=Candidatus Termititenax persephonae TaxID=2218525 RepID=A0A388TG53_9BACT|nr:retropepsin-like super family [Candidatus Termititenax persephonae]
MANTSQRQSYSFTYVSQNGLLRGLITEVLIENAYNTNKTQKVKALWDTGASCSLIRPEIARKLDLSVVSKTLISTPSEKDVPSNLYYVNVGLPNKVKVSNVLVVEGTPQGCDMLIGMDIITVGDFAISNFNKKTVFSFRIPSIGHIDFMKHSYVMPEVGFDRIGRNEPCPCGSGKKYKKCCGLNK